MTYADFIRARLGGNWVIARRSPRVLAKYGEDVICISKQAMRKIDREYRTLFGDPYNAVRAKMYKALLASRSFLINELQFDGIDPDEGRGVLYAIEEAIKAEQDRP